MICWKIRIFAYWTTPNDLGAYAKYVLWFAEKFVSLLIEQHRISITSTISSGCDLLKNSYLCLLNNTLLRKFPNPTLLWFAEKFVSLLIEQHLTLQEVSDGSCCDLLKNSYLCLLNNTLITNKVCKELVVICWKIRIFAYWTTPEFLGRQARLLLWFAEKFVSLLIEQHPNKNEWGMKKCCDLLKNSYLCLLNNTACPSCFPCPGVVICWKIRIFAYWTTPEHYKTYKEAMLWFAEKFVSLLIEQHPRQRNTLAALCCDLLKNSYLCLLNNTYAHTGVLL